MWVLLKHFSERLEEAGSLGVNSPLIFAAGAESQTGRLQSQHGVLGLIVL